MFSAKNGDLSSRDMYSLLYLIKKRLPWLHLVPCRRRTDMRNRINTILRSFGKTSERKSKFVGLLAAVLMALLLLPPAGAFAEESEKTDAQSTAVFEDDSGIIDAAALNTWMDGYLQEHGISETWQDFSVGFCYTRTGDCWFYNPDIWMYSASLYKVPVSMLMAEKEAAGELTPDSIIQGMTLEHLESTALVYSNNDSGHAMVSYLGGTYNGKCSDMTEKFTDLPEDYYAADFIEFSYYTARYMTQVMKTLYDGGDEAFPHVVDYLLKAQPGEYFNSNPRLQSYKVAQKYGAFEETYSGKNNNHCAAIIYTPTPIIVVVMTRNIADYQARIGEVGSWLADYALQLDEKPARTPAVEPTTETQTPAEPEETAQTAESTGQEPTAETPEIPGTPPADTQVSEENESKTDGNRRIPTAVFVIVGFVLAVLAAVFLVVISRRKNDSGTRTAERVLREEKTDHYRPRH